MMVDKIKEECFVCGRSWLVPRGKRSRRLRIIKTLCDECSSFIPERQWGKYDGV